MLGDGKVKLAKYDDDPETILTDFFYISDTSRYTASLRARDILAKKGGNRSVMSDARYEEISASEDALSYINPDLSAPYIKRICGIISNFTSEFKRKCAVGFFMAQGTTLRYPEEFKLLIDTEDTVRNVENENLNNLISKFSDELEQNLAEGIANLDAFIKSLPEPIRKEYNEKSSALFDPGTETGNIYKDIRKTYARNNIELTDDVMEKFKEVVLKYREARIAYQKPGNTRVCNFLLLDNGVFLKTARDALQPIINALPGKVLTDVVGE